MKKMILLAGLIALLAGCNSTPGKKDTGQALAFAAADAGVRDGMFIHLSHGYDDVNRASMALSLAVKLADTVDVLVFCDLEAVKLLTKTAEHPAMSADHYMCPKDALDELRRMNVTIMACPMCMKAAGIKAEDLISGVIVAKREKFFNFTQGRIVTLDY
jgi:predicted peroxiredoxin